MVIVKGIDDSFYLFPVRLGQLLFRWHFIFLAKANYLEINTKVIFFPMGF